MSYEPVPHAQFTQPPRRGSNRAQVTVENYLLGQLRLGFRPSYLITYHFLSPEETVPKGSGIASSSAPRNRRSTSNSVWNQTSPSNSCSRWQNDHALCSKNNRHLRNLIRRRHFGVTRLNRPAAEKYPMLFFLERGHGLQLHGHLLLPEPHAPYKSVEALTKEWHGYLYRHSNCLSKVRLPHVTMVTDPVGVLDYLTKEVTANNSVVDFEASIFIAGPTG